MFLSTTFQGTIQSLFTPGRCKGEGEEKEKGSPLENIVLFNIIFKIISIISTSINMEIEAKSCS